MSKKNEARVEFIAETNQFNQGITKMNSTITVLRSELKLNAEQMKGCTNNTNLLRERQKLLESELNASQRKIGLLNEKLNVAKEVFGRDSAEVQKLTTQINNAKVAQEKIRQAVEKTNAEITEQEQTQQRSVSAYQQLTEKITMQENELKQLQSEYADILLIQGKESSEAKRLQREIGTLSNKLEANKNRLNEVEKTTKEAANAYSDLGESTEEAGNNAGDSADGYSVVKDVIADLASQAIQGAIDKFKELSVEAEAALDKMQAKIGASEQNMTSYKSIIQDVYNNGWGDSLNGVSEALGIVIQQTKDLDNAQLKNVTENVMTLSDVYDMDYAESLRAANSLINQFGISSDEAFNLIVQGAQEGLNQNGDLLDVINEYSVQFANSGLSANDMFNMIKNGANEGVWSIDKMGDAYKEFNIRMSDGTANQYLKSLGLDAEEVVDKFQNGGEDAKTAMVQVANAIKNCDDKTVQYQAGVGIMGTMWEDMGQESCIALLNTEGAIKSANSAMESVKTDAYDNLATSASELGRTLANDILQPISGTLEPVLNNVCASALQNIDIIEPAILGVAAALGVLATALGITSLISGVQKAMVLLNGTMLANPVVLIATAITAAIAGIVTALVVAYNKSETFRNGVNALGNALKSGFLAILGGVKNIVKGIGDYIGSIKDTFTQHGGGIKGAAAVYVKLMTDRFKVGYNLLNKLTGGKLEEVKNTAVEKFTGLKDKAGESLGKLKGIASKSLTNMKNTFTSHGGGIKGAAAVVMEGVRAKFTAEYNLINKLTGGKLDELKNKAVEKLTGIKESFSGAIEKIKGFFDFDFHWPHIPTPKITVTWDTSGTLAKAGQLLGYPGMPNFGIQWNAEGAILTKPMIFGFANGMFQGGGEAGPEAVLPIAKLEEYIGNQMEKYIQPAQEIDYERLGKEVAKANAKMKFTATVNTRDAERFIKKVR